MPSIAIDTPTGPFSIWEEKGAIVRSKWVSESDPQPTPLLQLAADQIRAYFAGDLDRFDLPLTVQGSAFQQNVCRAMSAIPFGETRTYGDIARALGAPAQAIGQACGANPIPLIIPCHRVLSSTGLGGFSGGTGIETKIALLKHEGAASLLI